MFVGAAQRDLSVDLFGLKLPSPLFMAPIGVIALCAQDGHGDLATRVPPPAPGCRCDVDADRGSVEDVAAEFGETPGFFQLWTPTDRDLAASLVHRPKLRLQRHRRHAGHLGHWLAPAGPEHVEFSAAARQVLANYTSARCPGEPGADSEENPQGAVLKWISVFGNPLTWEDLPWLRSLTRCR